MQGRLVLSLFVLAGCLAPSQAPSEATTESALSGGAINWARSGGVYAVGSSYYNASLYPASWVKDGDRTSGENYGHAWSPAPSQFGGSTGFKYCYYPPYYYGSPPYVYVDFGATRTIGEVDIFSLQDGSENLFVSPTMTKSQYGLFHYQVYYLTSDRSAWVPLPNGHRTWNDKVWNKFTFTPLQMQGVMVMPECTDSAPMYVVEIEAWGDAPSCSTCTSTDSCSREARCVDGNGQYSTCNLHGVCNRGACGNGSFSSCNGTQVKSCDWTCIAGGDLYTTCGEMNYTCNPGTVTGYDTPPDCSACAANSFCTSRCTSGGVNKTCADFVCSDGDSGSLGVYNKAPFTTYSEYVLPQLNAGDAIIVKNFPRGTMTGDTKFEFRSNASGTWTTVETSTDSATGGPGSAVITYVAGKSETPRLWVWSDAGNSASGTVQYQIVRGYANPTVSDVVAIVNAPSFKNDNGTTLHVRDRYDLVGDIESEFEHFQGIVRLNNRSKFDFAVSTSQLESARSTVFFVKIGNQSSITNTQRFQPNTWESADWSDIVVRGVRPGSTTSLDHPGGMQAFGKHVFVGVEPIDAPQAPSTQFEIFALDPTVDPPTATPIITGFGDTAGAIAVAYLPNVESVPANLRKRIILLRAGAGIGDHYIFIKGRTPDGLADVLASLIPWEQSPNCFRRPGADGGTCPYVLIFGSAALNFDISTDDYQSYQFVTESDGTLYLIGQGRDGCSNTSVCWEAGDDWLDVFRVVWPTQHMPDGVSCSTHYTQLYGFVTPPPFCLVKEAQRHMILSDGAQYYSGGSIYLPPNLDQIWSHAIDHHTRGGGEGRYIRFQEL